MSAFFSALPKVEADKIIRLMGMYRTDPRGDKIDLGVGVYRTPEGTTPVFDAVRRAEHAIWETQETKSYTALSGDAAFHHTLGDLALGAGADWSRLAALSAPGGTGALRKGAELIQRSRPDAVVWLPDPTWANHEPVMLSAGLQVRSYRLLDPATGIVDREAMRADLGAIGPNDVILLHGCCHNPTGIDLAPEDWEWLAGHCAETGALPFVDMAYQGFAHGIEEDAAGLRLLADRLPEVLAAVSCSKTFGLYRDRAGLLLALCDGTPARDLAQGMMERLNRLTYAFPPDHGTRIVSTILADPVLNESWRAELDGMRARLGTLRKGFAEALRDASGSDRFHFIASGNGMFSVLPATVDQVRDLRERHGIYLIEDGRLNVAGLPENKLGEVARAVVDCGI